jgi:hypothetical protein
MHRTPPEANTEYSRGQRASEGVSEAAATGGPGVADPAPEAPQKLATGLFVLAVLGALLLLVAEFTTLFVVHASNVTQPLHSESAGSHHSYALALIAAVALVLAFAVWRTGSRPALLGLGVLGVAALLIALVGDLPDATASGLLLTSSHYVEANATPRAGFFIETVGALLLLIACAWGFLLTAPPSGPTRRSGPGSSRDRGRSAV